MGRSITITSVAGGKLVDISDPHIQNCTTSLLGLIPVIDKLIYTRLITSLLDLNLFLLRMFLFHVLLQNKEYTFTARYQF